ncbi:protein amnionless-like isoform X2 [Littorina saxatilis]|uniref:protein amnionless-like isoform X2 n=1 Tax=Littorina saxatilis TaxID=31220 RepID=UPI0038B4BBF0
MIGHGGSDAVYKRWLRNRDFENALNWNVQPPRAPCGNDRVIIPEDSPVIYLQMNTTLRELKLPRNGEIILGSNMQLGFTMDSSADCPPASGDVEFTAVNPAMWVNPDNWCATNTELADCQPNSPVDTENVPCVNDDVIFLRHRSYFVDLGGNLQVAVKSLKLLGTSFTTGTFTQYVNSTDGRKIFKPTSTGTMTSVSITRRGCDDNGGCACGNDQGQIQQEICAIRSRKCERSPCKYPVTPVGGCCDICGVLFNGTRGRGFNFNSFKSKMQTSFFNDYSNVTTAISITGAGDLQLVLKDQEGDGSDSARLAALIKADIEDDLKNGGHKYALDAISVTGNSAASTSPHTGGGGSSEKLGGGSIAGIVFGVVFIIVIAVIALLVFRRGRPDLSKLHSWPDWSNFSRNFTRFGSGIRQPPSGSATPPRTLGPLDPGFNNPLYNTAPFDDSNAREMELRSPMEEQPTFDVRSGDRGFDNPMYGAPPGAFVADASDTKIAVEKDETKGSSKN